MNQALQPLEWQPPPAILTEIRQIAAATALLRAAAAVTAKNMRTHVTALLERISRRSVTDRLAALGWEKHLEAFGKADRHFLGLESATQLRRLDNLARSLVAERIANLEGFKVQCREAAARIERDLGEHARVNVSFPTLDAELHRLRIQLDHITAGIMSGPESLRGLHDAIDSELLAGFRLTDDQLENALVHLFGRPADKFAAAP